MEDSRMPMDAPSDPISKSKLHWQLVYAAMVRSAVTMLSGLAIFFIAGLIAFLLPLDDGTKAAIGLGSFIGGFLLVSWLMTKYYCRRAVRCPRCSESLWDCGTGNFKPRRMKVRDDVRECPNCGAPIV
jgi:hypothetical protein